MSRVGAVGSWSFAAVLGLMGCEDSVGIVTAEPDLRLDPAALQFGNVQIGTSRTLTVLIRNPGTANLPLAEVIPRDDLDRAVFSFTVDRTEVAPNGAAQLNVTFTPNAEQEFAGSLIVRSTDDSLPNDFVLPVSGTGILTTLIAEPQNLDFGPVVVGTAKTLEVSLRNNTEENAQVAAFFEENFRACDSSDSGEAEFCARLADRPIEPDETFTLQAHERITLEVQFRPTIAGLRSDGRLRLNPCPDNNSACNVEIRTEGRGVESGFRCVPARLSFGFVNPGSCVTQAVTCTNVASEQVTVLSWGPAEDGGQPTDAEFSFEPSRIEILDEGDAVDVDVTYCPTSRGENTGLLRVVTDRETNPTLDVPLRGSGGGPDIEIVPTALNFGLVSLVAPARRTLLILNAGDEPLDVTSIMPDLGGTGVFSIVGTGPGAPIEPGHSFALTVEFQPTAAGSVETEMRIDSNDIDEPDKRVRILGEGISLPPCTFATSVAALNFGAVEVGRTAARAFDITNTGSNDCVLSALRLEPDTDAAFSLPDGELRSRILGPAEAIAVRAQFDPERAGPHAGALEFSISSVNSPFNQIPLTATAVDGALLVVPTDVDFGTVGVGCGARARSVTLYNAGNTEATVSSIAPAPESDMSFSLTSLPPPLPAQSLTIPAGASEDFQVGFRARRNSDHTGAVHIEGILDGAAFLYVVSLTGRGSIDGIQVDRFEQLGTPEVDILFVIDFTDSMVEEQEALANNFRAFLRFAEAQGLDYQIGVTSTDTTREAGRLVHPNGPRPDGCDDPAISAFAGPTANRVVTPRTLPDPSGVFDANVRARCLAGGGDPDEAGFAAAYRALTPPLIRGDNAGLLRRDALLSIVFVSDEPDKSAPPHGPSADLDFYANFFRSIKGFRAPERFVASAITGPETGACEGPGGLAEPAPRYVEMTRRGGGTWVEICTADWAAALEDLSGRAFGLRSEFRLTNQPAVNSIEVTVDGALVDAVSPEGTTVWSYDAATNAIDFNPATTPEPGAEIVVAYETECL